MVEFEDPYQWIVRCLSRRGIDRIGTRFVHAVVRGVMRFVQNAGARRELALALPVIRTELEK